MFELNPLAQPDAWWQHLVMLAVAAIIGYIIGYRSRKSIIDDLEEEVSKLDIQLNDCQNAPMPMATSLVKDDLKLVEGIGPKIEELLNQKGIMTFRQLSETSNEVLSDILQAAGTRFKMHDATTWPRQAELAVNNKWVELREWQDELYKGRA